MLLDRARVAEALPGYDLGDEIGAGAFGLVLAGWHRRLRRDVAIKVLPAGGPAHAAGFATEAQILASLDHPHIVRVYDYLQVGNLDLIVMEMLSGGSLRTRHRPAVSPEGACAVGLAVAGALSCAHAHGVLHRDIKPDNVLRDAAGLVKVVDFGIAKRVHAAAATASTVIGTPVFMAPEQVARGRLGPATDLYALAMMLYLLLAGATPFDPDSPAHAPGEGHADPADRRLRPPAGVPTQVADVVLRAMAWDPADRPASARDFAVDLAEASLGGYGPGWLARSEIRVQLDDEVRTAAEHSPARRPPAFGLETPARSVTTAFDPAAVAGSAAAFGSTSAPTAEPAAGGPSVPSPAGGTLPPRPTGGRAKRAGRHARPDRPAARRWHRRRTPAVAVAVLLLAATAVALTVVTNRSASASDARQLGSPLIGHTDWVTAVAFAPNGRILASASRDRTVRLWDVVDPAHPRLLGSPLIGHTDGVTTLAFSPEGQMLVSGGKDGTVRLWDLTDPAHAQPLGSPLIGHAGHVHAVSFAAFDGRAIEGRVLASSGADGTVRLWDVTDPLHAHMLGLPLTGHQDRVWSVAFSSDGHTLASGSADGTIRLWNATDPVLPRLLGQPHDGHPGGVYSVAFAPDTRTLGSSGKDATIRLWDVTDPAHARPLGRPMAGHGSIVWALAFSPDERTLASAAADHTVRLWDVTDRTTPRSIGEPLTGHTNWVTSVAFSPDGRTLASGSWDSTVRLWAVN